MSDLVQNGTLKICIGTICGAVEPRLSRLFDHPDFFLRSLFFSWKLMSFDHKNFKEVKKFRNYVKSQEKCSILMHSAEF